MGCEYRVRFAGQSWEREVAPSLVLVSDDPGQGSASIRIDGRTLLDARLDAPVTAIRLGNLSIGEHSLHIAANNPIAAYVNFLEAATNAAYIQRFCVEASATPLRFRYEKRQPGEEVLVLRIFSPLEAEPKPTKAYLKLKPSVPSGVGPFADLTFLEREAVITPPPRLVLVLVLALHVRPTRRWPTRLLSGGIGCAARSARSRSDDRSLIAALAVAFSNHTWSGGETGYRHKTTPKLIECS